MRGHAVASDGSRLSAASREQFAAGGRPNLRIFLDKIGQRRRRIPCSAATRRALEKHLAAVCDQGKGGRLSTLRLRETLRGPPADVPPGLLKELIDVARAYDDAGDGTVDFRQLLDTALESEPCPIDVRSPGLLLGALLVYLLLIGPCAYWQGAGWSFSDAIYYCVTLVGTLGNDHIYPQSYRASLATIIYLLGGLFLLYFAVLNKLNAMLSSYEAKTWNRQVGDLLAESGYGVSSDGPALEDLVAAGPVSCAPSFGPPLRGSEPSDSKRSSSDRKEAMTNKRLALWSFIIAHPAQTIAATIMLVLSFVVALGATVTYYLYGLKNFADALYWTVLTCATVGVSSAQMDLWQANTAVDAQQWLSFSMVVLVVPLFVMLLLQVGECCLAVRSEEVRTRMKSNVLPLAALAGLDADDNGISKLEFLCAVLMALDKVSPHDLWRGLELFRQLDSGCTGLLHAADLTALRGGEPQTLTPAARPLLGEAGKAAPSTGVAITVIPAASESVDREVETKVGSQLSLESQEDRVLSDLRQELSEKDVSLQAAESSLQQVQAERDELARENRLLRCKLTDVESRADLDKQRREEAERYGKEQGHRCRELERQLQEQESRYGDVFRQLQDAQRSLGEKTQLLFSAERHTREAQARCDAVSREYQEADARRKRQGEAEEKERELQNAKREQEELRKAVSELRGLYQGLRVPPGMCPLPATPSLAPFARWPPPEAAPLRMDLYQPQQRFWPQWPARRVLPEQQPRSASVPRGPQAQPEWLTPPFVSPLAAHTAAGAAPQPGCPQSSFRAGQQQAPAQAWVDGADTDPRSVGVAKPDNESRSQGDRPEVSGRQ